MDVIIRIVNNYHLWYSTKKKNEVKWPASSHLPGPAKKYESETWPNCFFLVNTASQGALFIVCLIYFSCILYCSLLQQTCNSISAGRKKSAKELWPTVSWCLSDNIFMMATLPATRGSWALCKSDYFHLQLGKFLEMYNWWVFPFCWDPWRHSELTDSKNIYPQ